jgi:hypothetical protein
MTESNPTTRKYPREMTRHNNSGIEGPFFPEQNQVNETVQFWTYIVIAFAAGFLTHLLWGTK